MPNFLFKAIAMFDDRVKILVQDLGKFYDTDMVYVNNMTKVIPRPAKQAIIEGASQFNCEWVCSYKVTSNFREPLANRSNK